MLNTMRNSLSRFLGRSVLPYQLLSSSAKLQTASDDGSFCALMRGGSAPLNLCWPVTSMYRQKLVMGSPWPAELNYFRRKKRKRRKVSWKPISLSPVPAWEGGRGVWRFGSSCWGSGPVRRPSTTFGSHL